MVEEEEAVVVVMVAVVVLVLVLVVCGAWCVVVVVEEEEAVVVVMARQPSIRSAPRLRRQIYDLRACDRGASAYVSECCTAMYGGPPALTDAFRRSRSLHASKYTNKSGAYYKEGPGRHCKEGPGRHHLVESR